jgi:GNAT superfamily N-acetyltransferase
MSNGYEIKYVENPDKSVWGVIVNGLKEFNSSRAGEDQMRELCLALYSPDQEVVGGVIAETYWNWLFVNVMWVKEELRGQGFGAKLLKMTEEEAIKRGAQHAYLDTFSFQAPEFYSKNGYKVFGKLENFPPGQQRFFYEKELQ